MRKDYRPDVDGLRALAVLAILGFHAFPEKITGGFVGVDIFFVISGYLITRILAKSILRNQFSFSDFYARRIRRIFPSLLIVLIACLLAGWLLFYRDEFYDLGNNVLGGLGFASNILLWSQTSYFDKGADLKPLLHLWSLGVEEQFYLVWPAILFGCWKAKLSRRTTVLSLMLVSFIANLLVVRNHAATAFYFPMFRGWEFLLGAIIAEESPQERKYNSLLSVLGVLLILGSVTLFTGDMEFPGWRALLPTLGTSLLIYSGPSGLVNRKILNLRPLVFIGVISYPLYLWHWPLLSFFKIMNSTEISFLSRTVIVLLSIILAWLTYVLVESPLRLSINKRMPAYLFSAGVLIFVVSLVVRRVDPLLTNLFQPQRAQLTWDDDNSGFNSTEECRKKFSLHGYDDKCLISKPSLPPTVALIGDSHANSLYFGMEKYFNSTNGARENVVNFGRGGCLPFWDTESESGHGGLASDCPSAMNVLLDQVVASKTIHTVILADAGDVYLNGYRTIGSKDVAPGTSRAEIYGHQLRLTVKRLLAAKKKVVLAMDFPVFDFDPRLCLARFPLVSPRKTECSEALSEIRKKEAGSRQIILDVLKENPNLYSINFDSTYCDSKMCWAMKDGTLLYRDPGHLSLAGSLYFADKISINRGGVAFR